MFRLAFAFRWDRKRRLLTVYEKDISFSYIERFPFLNGDGALVGVLLLGIYTDGKDSQSFFNSFQQAGSRCVNNWMRLLLYDESASGVSF